MDVRQDGDYMQAALAAPLWDSEVGRESGKDLELIDKEFPGERNKCLLQRLICRQWERVAGGSKGCLAETTKFRIWKGKRSTLFFFLSSN